MRNQQSWTVSFPTNSPKAIVVLIGWWGAKPRNLEKYAEIYNQNNGEIPCITVSGIADSQAVLTKNDKVLRAFAQQGLEETARLLQDFHRLPVIIHMLSNGGAMVWQHMEILLLECGDDRPEHSPTRNAYSNSNSMDTAGTEETPLHSNTNVSTVRKSIRGQIYDSSPAYPMWKTFAAALDLSGIGDVPGGFLLLLFLKLFFLILYWLETVWNYFIHQNKPHRMLVFWNQLLESHHTFGKFQAFVYSTADHVTDANYVQEFIAVRRLHSKVSVLELEDSDHIQHFRKHPELYKRFVQSFVNQVLEESESESA